MCVNLSNWWRNKFYKLLPKVTNVKGQHKRNHIDCLYRRGQLPNMYIYI